MNALTVIPYAEFGVQSNFSFLRGASKPEELVVAAELLGFSAIGLADRNTVAGVVRAWAAGQGREAIRLSPRLPAGLRRRHAGHPRLSAGTARAGGISAAC